MASRRCARSSTGGPSPGRRTGAGSRRGSGGTAARSAGRWSLLPGVAATEDADELAEAIAEQLPARWGVVFLDLLVRETLAVPWREVLWALRRMEARGTIRGGRFVNGFSGEQYAVPEAVDALRSVRKLQRSGETIRISAADPLNLVGIVLPGPRVPALPTNSLTYVDGPPLPPRRSPDPTRARPRAGFACCPGRLRSRPPRGRPASTG